MLPLKLPLFPALLWSIQLQGLIFLVQINQLVVHSTQVLAHQRYLRFILIFSQSQLLFKLLSNLVVITHVHCELVVLFLCDV